MGVTIIFHIKILIGIGAHHSLDLSVFEGNLLNLGRYVQCTQTVHNHELKRCLDYWIFIRENA